jgi:hypothetical protein
METSKLLPVAARERLIAATKIKDPFERLKAIDAAIDRVKSDNPSFFKQPEINPEPLKENK